MRRITKLAENWSFYKNMSFARDRGAAEAEIVSIPHTWNAIDGQDGGNDYFRGTCLYVKELGVIEKAPKEHAYIEFEGAAMTAAVYFNGQKLTCHKGGYSTFRVEVTELLNQKNVLIVEVNNSVRDNVYPQKADFTFYGGLYRMVSLIIVPDKHFALDYYGSRGIKITPVVKGRQAHVTVEAWVTGGAEEAVLSIADEEQTAAVEQGRLRTEFIIENVHLWDGVEDPYLYTLTARLPEDELIMRFGCRTFETDPERGFLLNGREYPLRGVSRHQDRIGVGNALTCEMHRQDMKLMKEIGANTIRLAHYQHAQEFYDLCDEAGMVVWAEIPYITMHQDNGYDNTLLQMQELIIQNYNHPSIFCWGLSNEITAASVVNDKLLDNHKALNELCHRLDKTRPTTMANVFMLENTSPMLKIPDINSYNLYYGWYIGELEQNEEFFDEYHRMYPERVIGLSEYGADANPQYQSPKPERGDYTEGYQCLYHEHMLEMIEKRPYLWATHLWNMFDFAADGRDEGGKHGINQKGLVTIDRGLKKDAFYLYKAYWNKKQSFVHICGRRFADRAEAVTEIKVYSNCSRVALYVDGVLFDAISGSCIFRFKVPIQSQHKIEAVADICSDSIMIQRVEKPNEQYSMQKTGTVVNWFEGEEIKPGYYSIYDTLNELRTDEAAGMIVNRLMSGAAATRGDIAESVKDNPQLQRMMGRMTLESLIKQAGDAVSEEQIRALNKALQQLKKGRNGD